MDPEVLEGGLKRGGAETCNFRTWGGQKRHLCFGSSSDISKIANERGCLDPVAPPPPYVEAPQTEVTQIGKSKSVWFSEN